MNLSPGRKNPIHESEKNQSEIRRKSEYAIAAKPAPMGTVVTQTENT
jgi:hypothetical protein